MMRMDGGTSLFWGPTLQIFFILLLPVLEETKKEKWPLPSLFFSFGVMVLFSLFFSVLVCLLGLLAYGLLHLDGGGAVKMPDGRDDRHEARLHQLAAVLPVEGNLLPLVCVLWARRALSCLCDPGSIVHPCGCWCGRRCRCGRGLCSGRGRRGASSILCLPAGPLARKAAVTDGLVLADARQVGLVALFLAPVARLALDEPEARHVDPVLLAQLFGHREGGLGRGRGRGDLRGGHGVRRWVEMGGDRWMRCIALIGSWGAPPPQFFFCAPSCAGHGARNRHKKRGKKRGRASAFSFWVTLSRRPPRYRGLSPTP